MVVICQGIYIHIVNFNDINCKEHIFHGTIFRGNFTYSYPGFSLQHQCLFIRFNALKMLEMLRDKRLMFIGDSIQRGMFESMVCLVQSVIADGEHSIKRVPPRKIFTIEVLISY